MRMLVISHTEHYRRDGRLVGWGPTVRELDALAGLFDELVHVAPLYDEQAPPSALPYQAKNVRHRPVPPAGGQRLADKGTILVRMPAYLGVMLEELRRADAVHVRCPAHISLMALLLLSGRRAPKLRWFKYAGNWRPAGREAFSYTFQRYFLERGPHRGIVTINGRWPGQPQHVHSFLNPCLTDDEIAAGRRAGATKELAEPMRLLSVGRVETAKGTGRTLHILAKVRKAGIRASLDLVGDGAERPMFEQLAATLGISEHVMFHGWLPRPALEPLYARAHFFVFPTNSEGWPKVLSEAMAYGVVPIASAVSSIPQYLQQFQAGGTCPPDDIAGFVHAIAQYTSNAETWKTESLNAMAAAQYFTYNRYTEAVKSLLFDDQHSTVTRVTKVSGV